MKKIPVAVKTQIVAWLAVLVSGFLRALSIHTFVNPNDFAPGGVTGIATILTYVTGINTGVYLFVINLPLLILAFLCIKKMFAVYSTAAIVLSSLFLLLFEKVNMPMYTDDRILAAIAGGVLNGVGVALMFKTGGSSGGTDIIATLLHNKFKSAGVSWFVFAVDSTVVAASFFVYDYQFTPIMLSLVDMFCSASVCDVILNGFKSAVKFEIVTSHPRELADEIMSTLHRGVTGLEATGMYSDSEKTLLVCVVRRRQIGQFQRIIKQYPDTFAYLTNTSEVMGNGFTPQ